MWPYKKKLASGRGGKRWNTCKGTCERKEGRHTCHARHQTTPNPISPFVSLGSPGHSLSSLSCPNQPLIPNPNPNLTLTPNSWKFTPIHLRFLSPPWNLFDAILHTQALDIPQPWRALRTISEPLSPGRSLIWTRAWADLCSPLHPPRKIPLPLPLSMPRYQLQLLLLLRLCRLRRCRLVPGWFLRTLSTKWISFFVRLCRIRVSGCQVSCHALGFVFLGFN